MPQTEAIEIIRKYTKSDGKLDTVGLGKYLVQIAPNKPLLATTVLKLIKTRQDLGLKNSQQDLIDTARTFVDGYISLELQKLAVRNGGEDLLNEIHSILSCSNDTFRTKPRCEKIALSLKATGKKAPIIKGSKYPADWYPPRPNFGSPTSDPESLKAKLGNPKFKVVNPGQSQSPIIFTDGWDTKNISKVYISQLNGLPIPIKGGNVIGNGNVRFYNKAHSALIDLFNTWEKEGLINRILNFGGGFVPRTIDKTLIPSNHAFGIGFDINTTWNGQKVKPAAIGQKGCLLELVPIANQHGFFWGGFYTKKIDAMHFEYAKL